MPLETIIAMHAAGELRIDVTVVETRGDKTRLGIEANREIPVHRREVQNAINRNRTSAA